MATETYETPTERPTGAVSNLAVTRTNGTLVLVAKWKVPSNLTSKSGNDGKKRATTARVEWHMRLYYPSSGKTSFLVRKSGNLNISNTTESWINLHDFFIGSTHYSRDYFYPVSGRPLLVRATCKVIISNSKGTSTASPASVAYSFLKPLVPSITELTQTHDEGHIQFTVNAFKMGKSTRERYDTRYHVDVYDSRTKKTTTYDNRFSGDKKSFKSEIDIPDRMQLTYEQYVSVTAKAMSRGFAGMSDKAAVGTNDEKGAWCKPRVLYVSYPNRPTIKSVSVSKTSSGNVTNTSKVTVAIDLKNENPHPSTGCILQVLRGTTAKTASEATASSEWADSTAVDDGHCTALACAVADVAPVSGTHTWLRIKSWNQHDDLFYRFSAPVEAKDLYVPPVTAANDKIAVLSLTSNGKGTAFSVALGINQDKANTGIEMQWSTSASGWQTEEGHTSEQYVGSGGKAKKGSVAAKAKYTYAKGLTIPPPGGSSAFTPNTTYYVRARLYNVDENNNTTYSPLSDIVSAKTETASDDKCTIVNAVVDDDGTGATLTIGINEDTNNDGTEVSWSDYSGAWSSNVRPSVYQFTWKHGTSQASGYSKSTWLHLRGLDAGTTYYARARRYLGSGDSATYTSYSPTYKIVMPSDAEDVMAEASAKVRIVSVTGGTDGTSAVVVVGFTENVECTGTEVSWAETEDAWESNTQPTSYRFDWVDTTSQSASWANTTQVTLRGLTENKKYWIRARRYLSPETGEESYTAWSPAKTITPVSQPESVTLTVPPYVARGSGCTVTWAYESSLPQVRWQLITGTLTTVTESTTQGNVTTTRTYQTIADTGSVVIARGSNDLGAHRLSAATLANKAGTDDELPLAIRISTGGAWAQSEAAILRIADVPVATIVEPSTLTAQPASFNVYCDKRAQLVAVLRAGAGGCHGDGPAGPTDQAEGDVVWQTAVTPTWVERSNFDQTNIVSNLPSAWKLASTGNAGMLNDALTLNERLAVTSGTAYTISVSGSWDEGEYWGIHSVTLYNGSESTVLDTDGYGQSPYEGVQEYTFSPDSGYTQCVATIMHWQVNEDDGTYSPEPLETFTTDVGDNVLVQLEVGSSATTWKPHADDLPQWGATLTAPSGLDLMDNGQYVLTIRPIDPETGLTGEDVTDTLDVLWAHQAPVPPDTITVTPNDVTTIEGVRTRSCDVSLVGPDGAESDDVYDVYRMTQDGPYLIASGVGLTDTVTDPYAPYGGTETGYRVACRTDDGDVDWTDYQYETHGRDLRIDFGGEYVELPYNIVPTESYEKDFELRRKLDGSMDGYWNDGVRHDAGFTTDLIRIYDQDKAAVVRRLARYVGPCFVRTPDGMAFAANVTVSEIGGAYKEAAIAVSIDATEVGLTEEYMGIVTASE